MGIVLLSGCFYASRTPVVDAAEEGDIKKLKTLLKQGRSINEHKANVKFGWTPLIAAIYQNNTNVVFFLLESGADVNIPDQSRMTAVMWAVGMGDKNLEVVKALIAHGADPKSALSCAASDPPKPKILEAVKAAIANQEKSKTHE
jgi:ankyrin repeat protein